MFIIIGYLAVPIGVILELLGAAYFIVILFEAGPSGIALPLTIMYIGAEMIMLGGIVEKHIVEKKINIRGSAVLAFDLVRTAACAYIIYQFFYKTMEVVVNEEGNIGFFEWLIVAPLGIIKMIIGVVAGIVAVSVSCVITVDYLEGKRREGKTILCYAALTGGIAAISYGLKSLLGF